MSAMTTDYRDPSGRNVGIDVGKAQLDVYTHELNKHWPVENSQPGIRSLITQRRRYKLARIVMEATGE